MCISSKDDTGFGVVSLDGLWDFAFLGDTDEQSALEHLPEQWRKTYVPSAFDASVETPGKRGMAMYRKTLIIPKGHPAELYFGALSIWSRVYLDGELLRENACGYEPLHIYVPEAKYERRELLVLVDNRFDFERVPMHEEHFDFYQYGGILREVKLRLLKAGDPWIKAIRVTPTDLYEAGKIHVDIDIAYTGTGQKLRWEYAFDNRASSALPEEAVEMDSTGAHMALLVPDPQTWSPDAPHLHQLDVLMRGENGKVVDRRSVRFGLRQVKAHGGKLWLNGEPLILKGVNRHEWHPNFGPCTPVAQMVSDVQLMKDMGCNFVRGSHYAQDQRFLDVCDELGMLVWEENLGWGQREFTLTCEKFINDHRQSLKAMVYESYNHPCVICWGFLNEAGSDAEYARPVFEDSVSVLRQIDPSRLITFASMYAFSDRYFDLVDFISINTYPGWYGCEDEPDPLSLIKPQIERISSSVDERGFAEKPLVISEIGVEGLYGWRDTHNDFFTEDFQARYLQAAIRSVLGNTRYSGIVLWHFSDVRTYGGGRSLMRPRAFNNKGVLDEYRRPKQAYETVKMCFSEGPIEPSRQ
ncbi:MAG: glycoside hydrolase family 2 TIM barrel-domain containing protein [Verrucomicrobiota bacterium JB024]|nr:glycoside hydrolase family 2 TIM barrel-domain containing protein [Verrucomicrobiota bacterium JB024]